MQQRSLQPSTIKTRVTALRSFFAYAQEYRVDGQPLCQANPVEGRSLRPKVRSYGKARALTQDEVQRLLGAVDLAAENGARDYAMLAGYLVLGRRNTEWRLARVVDFEASGGEIFYRWSGKGKSDELISVPDELWRVLQAYIAESGGRGMFDYIFLDRTGTRPISSRRMLAVVKRYASLAGLGDLRVHDLRHTATMLRRMAGADVDELREFLGDSSIQTTQVYIHRIERVADARGQAVAKTILNHRWTQRDTDQNGKIS